MSDGSTNNVVKDEEKLDVLPNQPKTQLHLDCC